MNLENWQQQYLFRSHPDPMWLYSVKSEKILDVNDAAVAHYSFSHGEFLNMTIAALSPPVECQDGIDNVVLLSSWLDTDSIRRHLTKDGVLIYVDVKTSKVVIDGESVVLMVARDISSFVLHNNSLRVGARVGTWRVEANSRAVLWSPETLAIHGLTDTAPRTIEEATRFFLPPYREKLTRLVDECLRLGKSFDINLELKTTTKKTIWVRSVGEPIRNDRQEITAIQGSFQDITDLMLAHDSADKVARPLAETLENLNDGVALLDASWRVIFLNRRGEELMQRTRSDAIGALLWSLFPNAEATSFERKFRNAMANRETLHSIEYVPALGLWLDISAYPNNQGMSMYFRDVTAEHTLTDKLHLLEAAVSHLNDVLIITKANSIDLPHGPEIVYVNDAFERVTGYSREEALGKTPRFLQGENTQRSELDRIRTAMVAKQPVRVELINYRKDGSPIFLEIDLVPLSDSKGRLTHFVAVERDISERKRLEKAMRENDERIKVFSEATTDVMWDWNLERNTLWWSDAIRDSFGYDPTKFGDVIGAWTDHIHPSERERVSSSLDAILKSDVKSWAEEYSVQHSNGSYHIVQDRASIVRDADGKARRIVGSIVDITERKELDNQLLQAQKMDAIGQLTGGVAHDFNNLLTVILGNAEMLVEQHAGDVKAKMMAELVVDAAQKGAQLTGYLLAFARKQPLEPKIVDTNKLVRDMEKLFKHAVRENIEIEFVQAGGLWMTELDGGQLEVALLNLIINARDAMPNGGQLTIETANTSLDEYYVKSHLDVPSGHYVCVSVSDHGVGMDTATLKRAFEPFFTTKSMGKGSGLGLSMVYGFVKQSGGHARIYSELGEGTTIKLYFPRANRVASEINYEVNSDSLARGSELILVVEDNDLVRQHLTSQLKALGYKVLSASNGPKAMELLQTHPAIDLLFTDVVMPGGMNGRQLVDAARLARKDLKVLYTSGYTESAIVHQGRLDPDVELLHKPYRRQQMASKVRKVLDNNIK